MRIAKTIAWLICWLAAFTPAVWAQEEPNVHSFELSRSEQGFSDTIYLQLSPKKEPFAVEPDWGGREVFRDTLVFHPDGKTPLRVGLAWDRSAHQLYVDLNHDGDLTNDPNGILPDDASRDYRQIFPRFPIEFPSEQGPLRYQLRIEVYDYGSQHTKPTYVQVLSSYQGTLNLHGHQWRLEVIDKLQERPQSGWKCRLAPTDQHPAGYQTNQFDNLTVPESLFFDGRCYNLNLEYRSTDRKYPTLWCTLTEKEVPLADLDIQGQLIELLAFGNSQLLVLPPLTDTPVTVPTGSFTVKTLALRLNQNGSLVSPSNTNELTIDVKPDQQNITTFGAPLTSAVDIERSGSVLEFNFKLKGAGGELYSPSRIFNYDSSKKPKVTIYKGDLKLASGDFEYG